MLVRLRFATSIQPLRPTRERRELWLLSSAQHRIACMSNCVEHMMRYACPFSPYPCSWRIRLIAFTGFNEWRAAV